MSGDASDNSLRQDKNSASEKACPVPLRQSLAAPSVEITTENKIPNHAGCFPRDLTSDNSNKHQNYSNDSIYSGETNSSRDVKKEQDLGPSNKIDNVGPDLTTTGPESKNDSASSTQTSSSNGVLQNIKEKTSHESKESSPQGSSSSMKSDPNMDITFKLYTNDCQDESSKALISLKEIFSKQLPKMPKEYIVRLVFDKKTLFLGYNKGGCYHWWNLLQTIF